MVNILAEISAPILAGPDSGGIDDCQQRQQSDYDEKIGPCARHSQKPLSITDPGVRAWRT